ncbi:MAG: 30S ribosomal protein S16 [Candidatus Omnitrophica bacterium]|nr:30S ribosomal protein S16 [Candidatus Omnitrophota bacterium]
MAVVVRLKRMGSNRKPRYRIVVADSRKPRDGRFIEKIGFYNPTTDPAQIDIEADRIEYWVKNGARLSETVNSLWKKTKKNV